MPLDQTLLALLSQTLPAFGFAAALLWVAAALSDESFASAGRGARRAGTIATVLATVAVWWTAQQGQAVQSVDSSLALLWISLAGAATAWIARWGVAARWTDRRQVLGFGVTLLAAVGCTSLIYAAPGDGLALPPAATLIAGLLLGAGLRVIHWPLRMGAFPAGVRAVAVVLTAALLTATAWRQGVAKPAFDPIVLPMVLLIALGTFGATSLRQMRRQRQRDSVVATQPAMTDGLTGLPNRTAFEVRLARGVERCDKERRELALMVINLDGFKPVNATFGHAVGDQLLKQVAKRIARLQREGDFLARLNADEFALLVTDGSRREHIERQATAIVESIAQPYRFGTREIPLGCSIGAAIYPEHGEADKLLARADAAMQSAKRAGGARLAIYTAEMDADLTQDFELLRDLRHAIDHDGLDLAFQPKINAGSGQVTAAEALLRWRHPTRGDVSPAVFVAVAERFGLVNRLGDWVIERACRQQQRWSQQGLAMRVAINLSAQHLRQPDLVPRIRAALNRNQVEPGRLTCEITETLAMENTRATQAMLAQLGALGVHLSIDDFGTGYSSLSYLRSLPASEIKIDRSFVLDLERSADARAVVDAVVKLAHALGKRVVAEGVETLRQRRILTELGCDELQGFLFARPMSADDLLNWALDARNRDEDAFRSSLYVSPGEGDPRQRVREPAAKPPRALH